MPDIFTKKKRSWVMSRIRGKWTRSERKLHGLLKGRKVRHKMYPKMLGSPDVLIYPRTVVFIDGCFWHGCPKCYVRPKSNRSYWWPKIQRNKTRDAKNRKVLRRSGFRVMHFWEHQFSAEPEECLGRMLG